MRAMRGFDGLRADCLLTVDFSEVLFRDATGGVAHAEPLDVYVRRLEEEEPADIVSADAAGESEELAPTSQTSRSRSPPAGRAASPLSGERFCR